MLFYSSGEAGLRFSSLFSLLSSLKKPGLKGRVFCYFLLSVPDRELVPDDVRPRRLVPEPKPPERLLRVSEAPAPRPLRGEAGSEGVTVWRGETVCRTAEGGGGRCRFDQKARLKIE